MSSVRRSGRQGRTAAAGRAGPRTGRAADCGRQHGNPPRRGRERERSCQRKKRAGGCRNARGRMRKIQAGRRSALGGTTMKTHQSGDPAIRRSGDPAIRRSGDPAIRRSGDPAIRRSGDPAIILSGGSPLSPCQALSEIIFRAPSDGRKRHQRADHMSSFVEDDHRDLSDPVARFAGAHSAQTCRASQFLHSHRMPSTQRRQYSRLSNPLSRRNADRRPPAGREIPRLFSPPGRRARPFEPSIPRPFDGTSSPVSLRRVRGSEAPGPGRP